MKQFPRKEIIGRKTRLGGENRIGKKKRKKVVKVVLGQREIVTIAMG